MHGGNCCWKDIPGYNGKYQVNYYGEIRRVYEKSRKTKTLTPYQKKRCPDWDEMCKLKDMFFEEDECCVQYHPPKSEYVNNIPYCLHIWRPIEEYTGKLPVPPSILVGIKGVKLESEE